ncbi:MAG: UDP-3-O-[3-hydroxymyristoyl] glucosamine N-acyltransferase [Planctomycetota bacterium]|jgi:UDP-3-O-[3-hydroxymyristoyl] glucosamine N-acyltransferase
MQISAKELAYLLKAEILGNPDTIVNKLAKIEEADKSSICFIANPKYDHYALDSQAGIIVVNNDFDCVNNQGTTFLKVENAYTSFTVLLEKFASVMNQKVGIEQPSYLGQSSTLGKDVYLGAFAYIGDHVKVGDHVKIYPHAYIGDNCELADNVTIFSGAKIYHETKIGENSTVHANTVIGSDGFGFAPQADGTFKKVPQTGNVVIGKNVEIGANTVIDRATMGSTVIKDGVKLDNLVQIAHNVEIGENSVVASQSGISGSTKLGKYVMVGGQVGFVGHITIADGVKINAQSGVSKAIEEKGKAVSGSPAEPFRQHYKNQAMIRKLPELMNRIKELEQKLENK